MGTTSGGMSLTPEEEEWEEGQEEGQLSKVNHYWEYMTIKFSELDSVRYINFYYEEASTNREKALGWILLELSQKGEELY